MTQGVDGDLVVDIPSMWRADEKVRAEVSTHDRIRFDLPYSLGRVDGRIAAGRLVADVQRSDGAKGQLVCSEWNRPALVREELRVDAKGVVIAGTLVRPADKARAPAVVVLHGGGDSCRDDSPPYRFWGQHLASLGFAVLLYDKRGNGASTGDWRQVGFGERADDVAALVTALAARDDVDASRIGLLAVSQGGWVAAQAARRTERIAFMVLVSCPAVSPLEADTHASWLGSRQAGLSVAEADERTGLWREYAAYLRAGAKDDDWQHLLRAAESMRDRPWFARHPFDPEPRRNWFTDWYPLVLDADPRPDIAQLKIPTLWVFGSADTQSEVGRNVAVLTELRDRVGVPLDIAVMQGGDHGIGIAARSAANANTWFTAAPGFLETVETWLMARTSAAAVGVDRRH